MAHRYFEGKAHAALYSKYRPIPPSQLIGRIVSFLKEKYDGELSIAVDVGCGSGQSTSFFAPYFKNVIGTDISSAQIEEANKTNELPNVKFSILEAEKIPFPDSSVQLIAASQAAHWFDLPKFYEEGRRALCSGGVMALFGYEFPKFRWNQDPSKNPLLDEALNDLYLKDLNGYWAAERKLVDSRYINYIIPYNDFTRDESFYHETETRVSDLTNYCKTWSGFRNYCKKNGDENGLKLVEKFQNRVMSVLESSSSPENTIIMKRTSFFLLMGRKQ